MKKCPVCKVSLTSVLLEENLPANHCPECEGHWISSEEYYAWLETQDEVSMPSINVDGTLPLPVRDNNKALICPDCGKILRRFKIAPDIEFHLDRCGGCNGVWFDKNEWEVLRLKELHHNLHSFFTEGWQDKLKGEEMKRRYEALYLEKFGQDDYEKIKEMRVWLDARDSKNQLIAYLTDKSPYQG